MDIETESDHTVRVELEGGIEVIIADKPDHRAGLVVDVVGMDGSAATIDLDAYRDVGGDSDGGDAD